MFFLLVVLSVLGNGYAVERFVIKREENSIGDEFDIPKAFCHNITKTPKCSQYGAVERQPGSLCQCKCPPTRSSLIYNGNKWNCTDDLIIRHQENCAVHAGFEDPSTDQLVTRAEGQVLLWNIRTKTDPNSTCGLDILLSRCLSCLDGWTPITDTDRIKVFVDSSSAHLRILPPKSKTLSGRIIKVVFNSGCAVSTIGSPCLLFKLAGQVNCSNAKPGPPLPSSSSAVVPQTRPLLESFSTLPSSATISPTSTAISITPAPSVTKTSVVASTNVNIVLVVKQPNTERRRVENGDTFLFIGLCVAPLFILIVIIVFFAVTCYRRQAKRSMEIIQIEPRESPDSFVLANPFYAYDNEVESSVDQPEEANEFGFQTLGHITLFRLESHNVADVGNREHTPRIYACPDKRLACMGRAEDSNESFVKWHEGDVAFSTFLDSFPTNGSRSEPEPPSPPPPYGNVDYYMNNGKDELNQLLPIYSITDQNKPISDRVNLSRIENNWDNSNLQVPLSSSGHGSNPETGNEENKSDEVDLDDVFAVIRGVIDELQTPRPSNGFPPSPSESQQPALSSQEFEDVEIMADFRLNMPSNGYPMYDFSFDLVSE